MHFTIYQDRFDEKYQRRLLADLDIDKLCREASAPGKPKAYNKGRFTKGVVFDFCGLAAGTLLGIHPFGEKPTELREEISKQFLFLLSTEGTQYLNERGVYLKSRFIFCYPYSSFSKSLMEAEVSLNRPLSGNRKSVYDFNLAADINENNIRKTSLYTAQQLSLSKLAELVENNPDLVFTRSDRSDNTLQVKFSPLPMPLCLLVINRNVYADPYTFAQQRYEENVKNLFYHYPVHIFPELTVNEKIKVTQGARNKKKDYYANLTNHFDYQWSNQLTLFCKDATDFITETNKRGLSSIKEPQRLTLKHKVKRITDYLYKNRIPYTKKQVEGWEMEVMKRIKQHLAFEYVKPQGHQDADKKADHEGSRLAIGIKPSEDPRKNGPVYYLHIDIPEAGVKIHYERHSPEKPFRYLLHYAVAFIEGRKTEVGSGRFVEVEKRLFNEIAKVLSGYTVDAKGEKKNYNHTFIFKYILDEENNCQLRISNVYVEKGYREWAKFFLLGRYGPAYNEPNKEAGVYPIFWFSEDDDHLFDNLQMYRDEADRLNGKK